MSKPKVTAALRRTWQEQLAQDREERAITQSGRPRDASSIAEMDHAIAVREALLALPIGAPIPQPPDSILTTR